MSVANTEILNGSRLEEYYDSLGNLKKEYFSLLAMGVIHDPTLIGQLHWAVRDFPRKDVPTDKTEVSQENKLTNSQDNMGALDEFISTSQ